MIIINLISDIKQICFLHSIKIRSIEIHEFNISRLLISVSGDKIRYDGRDFKIF